MESPERPTAAHGRWTSLWVVALLSLMAQLALYQFFSFGEKIPLSIDVDPSNLWRLAYHFPPLGTFQVLNWLGVAYLAQPLNPLSLAAAHVPSWIFFTAYLPVVSTCALLVMAALLRELEISRPAALFGAVTFAWQGDLLSFLYPGHFGYITSWPFFALAAWGALRAARTGRWPYAVISGACCGTMVGLLTNADRGGIASLLIATLYLAPLLRRADAAKTLRHFVICFAVAAVIALAPLLALFKSNIQGVKMGGSSNREEVYDLCTQYSFGPAETLTYLVPGLFGWDINNRGGLYWGWIGESPEWPRNHQGNPNSNLAISTSGTVATLLALVGVAIILPGRLLGRDDVSDRQRFYARLLLALGLASLVLSWGWHTGLYHYLFALPLMDKWRDPLKWLEMFNLGIIPLSALGLDHLLGSLRPGTAIGRGVATRFSIFVGIVSIALALGLIASYALADPFVLHFINQGIDQPTIADMMSTMHTSLGWALILAVLLIALPFALSRSETLRQRRLVNPMLQEAWEAMLQPQHLPLTLALGLAGLSTVQLGWVANHFIQPAPTKALSDSNPLLDTLHAEGDRVRVSVATDDFTLSVLLQNQFAALGISCLDISAASRIPDDLATFLGTLDDDQPRLWFLAGVKNLVVPETTLDALRHKSEIAANIAHVDGYTIAATASPDLPSHALIVLKDYLEKATLVHAREDFSDDASLLKRLKDPKWQPRESILINRQDPAQPTPGPVRQEDQKINMPPQDEVTVKTYSPTEIDIDVKTARQGYVLIDDQYDPDWAVQIDGGRVPLLRADYILRGIPVPAGDSAITMHYTPHYLGVPAVAVSLFSDGAMLVAWLVAAIGLRRQAWAPL